MNQRERISKAIDELVDAICPSVAEPKQPTPTEPVIDERQNPATAPVDPITPRHSIRTPTPAADPRLTDEEIDKVWCRPGIGLAEANRAVADAQLEKAKVTISEAEIRKWWSENETLEALLIRHGIEVVP